ncbi:HMA2 domain-containing protein [Bacillus sp. T33-2]|uniref:HMA2 domain-containing protein n=1 Tax=Bacillus sp. T33-2 TaxID=2054168 RepID=UPI000C7760E3|nr:metal ABC transporter ATPase [Bacillus sp. T33-2]PLR95524.1 metal ABC transporter ATPase [Bacillus sp. T33-2]
MLNKLQELRFVNRINKILKKNCIEIAHFIPGRIRLRSTLWKNNAFQVKQIISHFENESRIVSIQYSPETGSLLINYDCSPVDSVAQIELWVEQIERLSLKVNR